MKDEIRAAQDFLRRAQHSDGGWPYQVGMQCYPEPTCYSLLALSTNCGLRIADCGLQSGKSEIKKGLQWLQSRIDARGALILENDDEPHWSTSLVVLTLSRLKEADDERANEKSAIRNPQSAIRERCVQWLLSWQGKLVEPQEGITVNSQLRGWPWLSDTFSWVEPTSYAVLALKLYKKSTSQRVNESTSQRTIDPLTHVLIDQRVAEAERLLLDRACVEGGWNYGGRIALDHRLTPFLPTTALAALALQDVQAARPAVDQALEILRREVRQNQSALALALTILCFHVFNQPTDEFVTRLLHRQRPDGSWRQAIHLTALAVLALTCVTGGSNVFKV